MKTVRLTTLGRMGNNLFRWSFAKALCEQNGYELRTEEWPGESIFTLDGHIPKRPDGTEDIVIDGYCQNQEALIYSRADCRRWFELKPEIEQDLHGSFPKNRIAAHIRGTDYRYSGYPVLSRDAVYRAVKQAGLGMRVLFFSDEDPTMMEGYYGELSFLPDFYSMMTADVLFRANSSFSFWAGVLSHGRIFSPIITGLAGGVEHDNVPYVEGLWPRLAELPNITDLYLPET